MRKFSELMPVCLPRYWTNSARNRASSADSPHTHTSSSSSGPRPSADTGRLRADTGPTSAALARTRRIVGPSSSALGPRSSADTGPTSARHRQTGKNGFDQLWPGFGRVGPEVDQLWPEIDTRWHGVGKLCPEVGQIWPRVRPKWTKPTDQSWPGFDCSWPDVCQSGPHAESEHGELCSSTVNQGFKVMLVPLS